jgi:hypothetical protein
MESGTEPAAWAAGAESVLGIELAGRQGLL